MSAECRDQGEDNDGLTADNQARTDSNQAVNSGAETVAVSESVRGDDHDVEKVDDEEQRIAAEDLNSASVEAERSCGKLLNHQ